MTAGDTAPPPADRRCLAGVDEAGLGPILGPLVVAGVAMEGPAGLDPWHALQELVSRDRHAKGKVRVADSKKVKQGPHGFERLEATVLSFWAAWRGSLPADLATWLEELGVDPGPLRACPWYHPLDLPLPLQADRGLVTLHGDRLRRRMDREGMGLVRLAARPVDVAEWNDSIARTDNKSLSHLHAYGEVLGMLIGTLPGTAHLVADRAGGRSHYRKPLQQLGGARRIETLREGPGESAYRIHRQQGGVVTVTFASRGEDRAFPTALASCTAKYVRELMVHLLNRWFTDRVPGLRPTAGYYVDGHRFLRELEPHLDRLQVPMTRLVRIR